METDVRQKQIIKTSIISMAVNLCIAAAKIIVGLAASSLAIVSEGINNATDAGSSLLTLVGTRLSARHPDAKHPFGYGRIEYLTSLTVSVLILFTGLSLIYSSVQRLLHPAPMEVSILAIILVAVSAIIKFFLGLFVTKAGRRTESASLTAVGKESRNDSFFSLITIAVSILYLTTHISLDAVAGIVFAAVILWNGFVTLKSTVSELIGRPGKAELAAQLYREIRSADGVLNAADMMLHNYGPDNWSGSVNIEIDYRETLGDIYESIHALQLRIRQEYNVTMVFGLYAVNHEREALRDLRLCITEFIRSREHLMSYHALYLSEATGKIYIDFVVDYELKDWEGLRKEFTAYMKEKYPENEIDLVIETEYV